MERAADISARRLAARIGQRVRVLVDEVAENGALARSQAEAPQIDGVVRIEKNVARLRAGEFADVEIVAADAYDLTGRLSDSSGAVAGCH
jgi:ribosomal protein S12 methylthiotransferase